MIQLIVFSIIQYEINHSLISDIINNIGIKINVGNNKVCNLKSIFVSSYFMCCHTVHPIRIKHCELNSRKYGKKNIGYIITLN